METEEDRVDSNDDEEINIYGDLCDFDLGEEIEKLKNEITNKDEQIVTLKSDIDKLNDSIEELKKNESNLKRNISALYQTAKAEIERKNRMIEDLRKQLESSGIRRFNPNFGSKRKIRESSPDANTAKRFKCDLIEIDSDNEEFCRNNEAIDCDKEEPEFDRRGEYRSKRTDNKYRGRDDSRRFESRRNDALDGKKDHELRNRVIDCDEKSKFNDRSRYRSKSRDNRYRSRDDSSRYEYRKSDVIDRDSKHEPENNDADVDQKSKFDDRSELKLKNIDNKSRRRDDGRKNESRRNVVIDGENKHKSRNNDIDSEEKAKVDIKSESRSKSTDSSSRKIDDNKRNESRINDAINEGNKQEPRNNDIDCDEKSKINAESESRLKSTDNSSRKKDDSKRYKSKINDTVDKDNEHEPRNNNVDCDEKSKIDAESESRSKSTNNSSRKKDGSKRYESRINDTVDKDNKHEPRSNNVDCDEKSKIDAESERSKSTNNSSRKKDDSKRYESRTNDTVDEDNKHEPRNSNVDCDEKSKIDAESESRSKSINNSSRKKDDSKRYQSRTNDTVDEDNKHDRNSNIDCDEKSKIDDKSESRSKSTGYRHEKRDVDEENKHESRNNDVDCDKNSKLNDKSDSRSKSTSNRYKRDDNSRYESRKNDVEGENKHEPSNSDVDCDQKSKFVEESEFRLNNTDNRYRRRYDSSIPNCRRNDVIGNERESSFDSSRYRIGNRRRNNENRFEPRTNSIEYDKHESYSDDNREFRSNYNNRLDNRYRIRNRSPFRFSDSFRYRSNYKFESETNRYCDRIGSQEDDGYFSRSKHPDERYNGRMSRRTGRDEVCGDIENRMFRSRSKDSSDNFRNDDREFSERSNFRRSDDRSPAPEQHMQQTTSFHPFVTERNENTRRSITPMPEPDDIEEPKPKPPKKRLKMLIEVEKKYKRNKLNSSLHLSSEIDSPIKKTKEVSTISGDDKKSAPHSKKVREESVAENEKKSVKSTIDKSDAKRGCASSETKNSKRKDTNSLSKLSDLSEISKSIPEKIIEENLQDETFTKKQHLKQTETIKLSTTDSGKESSSTSTQKKSEEVILKQQKPKQFEEDASKDNKENSKNNVSESSDKSSEEIDKKNQRRYKETNIFPETLDFETENGTDNSKKLIITEKIKCDSTKEKEENANERKNCSDSKIKEKDNESSIRQMSKEKNSVRSESNKEDGKNNKELDKEADIPEQCTRKTTEIDENESKPEDINKVEKCIDTESKLEKGGKENEIGDEKLDGKKDNTKTIYKSKNFKQKDQKCINKQRGEEDIGSKDNLSEQQQNKDITESDRSKKQKSLSITDTPKIITNDKGKDTKSKEIPLEIEAYYVSKKVDDMHNLLKEDGSTDIFKNSDDLDKETIVIASQSTSILNKRNENEESVKENKKDEESSTNELVEESVPTVESNAETIDDIQRYIYANNRIEKGPDVSKKSKETSSNNPQEKMHSKKDYKKDDKNESKDINKALDDRGGNKKDITVNVTDLVDSSNKSTKQDEKRRDIELSSESTTDDKVTTEHVAIQKHMNTTKDKVAKREDVNKKTKVISEDTKKDCPKKDDKKDSGKSLEHPKQDITEKKYLAENKFEGKQNKHIIEKQIAEQYDETDGRSKSSIKRRRVLFLDVLEADVQEKDDKTKDSVKSKRGSSKEKNISVEERNECLEDNTKDGIVKRAEEKDKIATNKLVQELNEGINTKNTEVSVSETNKKQVVKGMQENINKKNEDMDKGDKKESKKSCVPQTKEVRKHTDDKPRNKEYSKDSDKEGCSGDKKNEKAEVKVSDNKKLNPRVDFAIGDNVTESGTNKGKKDEKIAKQSVEKETTSTNDADKKGDCPKATKEVIKKLEIDRPNKEQIKITVQKNNDKNKNENDQKQSPVEKHKQQKCEEKSIKVEYVTSHADKISSERTEHCVKPAEKNLKPKRRKSTFIEASNIDQNKKPENSKREMEGIEQSVTQMTISPKPNKDVHVPKKVTQENIKTSLKEDIKTGIEKRDLEKQSDKMKESKQAEVSGKSETQKTSKVDTARTNVSLSVTRRCINKIKRRITFYATDDLKVMNQNKCTEFDSKNTEEKTSLTENAQHSKTSESKQTDSKVSEKVDNEKCHVQKTSIEEQNLSNKCTEFDSNNTEQNTENAQHNKTSKRKQTDSKVFEKVDKEKDHIQKSSIEEQNQSNKCTEFDSKNTEQNTILTKNAQHNRTSESKQTTSKLSEKADKEKDHIQKSSIEEQNQSNKCTEFDSKNTEQNTENAQHNKTSKRKQTYSKVSEKADKEKGHIQKSSIEEQNQSNKCTEFDSKNTEQNTENAQHNKTSKRKQTDLKVSEKADNEKCHVQKSSIEEQNQSNKCTEFDSKNTEQNTENAQHNKTSKRKQTNSKVSEKADKEKGHIQKSSIEEQNQSNTCTEFDSKNTEQNTENAQHNKTSKRKQTNSKVSEKADKEKGHIQKSSIEEQNQSNTCTEFDSKNTEQNTENAQHNKTSKRKQTDSKVSEKADKEKGHIQKSSIEEQNQSNKCTEFDSKNTEQNTENAQHNKTSKRKQTDLKVSEKADKEKGHIQKSSIEEQNQSNKCTEFDSKNTEQNTILRKSAQHNRSSESKQTTSKLSEKADREKDHVQKSSIEEQNESNKCTEFDSNYTEEKTSLTEDVQHNKTFESKQTASKLSEKDDIDEDHVQKSSIEEQNESNLSLFNTTSNTSSTSSTCSTSSSSSSSSSSTSSDSQEELSDISLNSSKPEEKLIEIKNVEQEQTHSDSSLSLSESSTSEETVVMGKLEHKKKIDKKYDSIIKQCLHTIDVETKAADVKSNSDDDTANIDNKNVTAKMTQSKVKVLEIVTISGAISKNAVEDGIKITSNTDESLTNMSSSSRSASQNISSNSRKTATKRRITPIPVKDEKPVSSFKNILTKTCQPKTFNTSSNIGRNLHLTHEGEIPVLHLEENQINNLPTEMHINDRNIISLLDSMNISNIDLDIPKFKNSSSESAVNSEGKDGGSSGGNLTFKNIMEKVTTSTPVVSAKSEQVESGVPPTKRQKTESDVSNLQISKNTSDLSVNLSTDKVGSNVQSNVTTTVQRRRRRCRLVIRD